MKYIPIKKFITQYDLEKKDFKANFITQLRLLIRNYWHVNVTLKYLKMWNPKKK